MVTPSLRASAKSSRGVVLDENMISPPVNPTTSDIINSVRDEQSTPQPSSLTMRRIEGFGVAFTAKYSRNPGFHENARCNRRRFSLMPFSSYRWNGVGYSSVIFSSCSRVTNVFFMVIAYQCSGSTCDGREWYRHAGDESSS